MNVIKSVKEVKMKLHGKMAILITAIFLFSGALAMEAWGCDRAGERGKKPCVSRGGGGGACGQPHGIVGMGGRRLGLRALKHLDLTDDQKTRLAGIIKQHRDQGHAVHSQLMAARKRLHDAIHIQPVDEKNIRDAHRQMALLMEELAVLRAKAVSNATAALTPDQKMKLKKKRQSMSECAKAKRRCRKAGLDVWLDRTAE